MKNTLWTFGCSFTAEYHPVGGDVRTLYDDYKEWKGGVLPPTWPTILSKNLNMELKNKGLGGTGNDTIFKQFCDSVDFMKAGDIVILQWTSILRYLLADYDNNNFVDILPSMDYPEYDYEFISKMTINRSKSVWYSQIVSYIKLIQNFCKLSNIKLFIWTADSKLYPYIKKNYNQIDTSKFIDWESDEGLFHLMRVKHKNSNNFTIQEETNNFIDDAHMGEFGHKVQADIILKFLINNGVNL